MRLSYVVMLGLGATAIAACGEDEFTAPTKPPTAAVRIVNGLNDGATVDVRAVDQIEWSPTANGLAYRNATVYFPTEAGKPRRLRVFGGCVVSTAATCTTAAVSTVHLDTLITFDANTRVTLLLTGSTAAGAARRFIVISDDVTPPSTGIGVRLVNASTGAIDGYLTATSTTAISGSPTFSAAAGPGTTSAYVTRAQGAVAAQVTASGLPAPVLASSTGSLAPPNPAGTVGQQFIPAAGVDVAGTKFSVYYFPAAGVITTPTVLWLVDRNPAD